MPEPDKGDEKMFAFWLVERFLPHDEEVAEQQPIGDRQFYVGLALSLTLVVGAGMLIRGCAI